MTQTQQELRDALQPNDGKPGMNVVREWYERIRIANLSPFTLNDDHMTLGHINIQWQVEMANGKPRLCLSAFKDNVVMSYFLIDLETQGSDFLTSMAFRSSTALALRSAYLRAITPAFPEGEWNCRVIGERSRGGLYDGVIVTHPAALPVSVRLEYNHDEKRWQMVLNELMPRAQSMGDTLSQDERGNTSGGL